MDTFTLKQILLEELQKYTGKGLNDVAYLTTNESAQIYSVLDIAVVGETRIVATVLVARLVNDQVIIEIDRHDKMLVDALLECGVPEDQIILAYRGDSVPA